MMSDRFISTDKETKINEIVVQEVDALKEQKLIPAEAKDLTEKMLRTIEIKISEAVSKALSEEGDSQPWFCHLQRHTSNLHAWEKPKHYHINRQRQLQVKSYLGVQAEGYERVMVASTYFKVFLVKSNLQV